MTHANNGRLTREQITRAAEELIIVHGEDAYDRASEEVSQLITAGAFVEAGSWQLIRDQILRRQEANRYLEALDRSVMLSE